MLKSTNYTDLTPQNDAPVRLSKILLKLILNNLINTHIEKKLNMIFVCGIAKFLKNTFSCNIDKILVISKILSNLFLAAMSSSRSDVVTLFVCPFVRPKPYFSVLQNEAM